MFLTHLSQITTVMMVVTCVGALWIGRWPERVTAIAYAANWIGSALWEDRRPRHHGQPVWLAVDLALLLILLVLTVSCRRTWVLWMAACSLLVVLTHVMGSLEPRFGQWTYITAYYIWSVGALLSFSAGVVFEGRKPVRTLIRFG